VGALVGVTVRAVGWRVGVIVGAIVGAIVGLLTQVFPSAVYEVVVPQELEVHVYIVVPGPFLVKNSRLF
jgi:hypothetical protein